MNSQIMFYYIYKRHYVYKYKKQVNETSIRNMMGCNENVLFLFFRYVFFLTLFFINVFQKQMTPTTVLLSKKHSDNKESRYLRDNFNFEMFQLIFKVLIRKGGSEFLSRFGYVEVWFQQLNMTQDSLFSLISRSI